VLTRSIVDLLVDGDGRVNVGRGKGFTLDDGLDSLVDVVVDVLVGLNTAGNLLPDDGGDSLGVVVGVSLFLQLGSVLGDHVVLGLSNNLGQDVEFMLGVQNLLVGDGLNSVLVVVNVSLSVNGLDGLDLFTLLDVFLDDFRGGFRADLGRVGLVGSGKEFLGWRAGEVRSALMQGLWLN
jgi:hypothetical protein